MLITTLLAGLLWVQAQTSSETYYVEDFESLGILGPYMPDGWTVSTDEYGSRKFAVAVGNGVDGSQAFAATNMSTNGTYWFYTQAMNLDASPIVEFQYNSSGVLGEAPANCMSLYLSVSTDNGASFTLVDSIPATEFVSSSTYASWRVTLPADYADQSCNVKLEAVPTAEAGTVNLYIDNFAMGTPAEALANDLMIQGALQGSTMPSLDMEYAYTVNIFNNGTEDQDSYTLNLKSGETILSTTTGSAIEAGVQRVDTLKWTPAQAGNYALQAEIVLESDENPNNNLSEVLNVEVQESGFAIEIGHGMDESYLPVAFNDAEYAGQILYTMQELSYTQGDIVGLSYEGSFKDTLRPHVTVWMGETDSITFVWNSEASGQDMFDVSFMTKVFDGEWLLPKGENQRVDLDLDNVFSYSGTKNLVVYFYTENEEIYEWEAKIGTFYGVSALGRVRGVLTSGEGLNPENPGSGNFQASIPNTVFRMENVVEQAYTLTFNVTDMAGNAVDDAVVNLAGTTYPAGQYVLEDLKPGDYDWTVSKGEAIANGTVSLVQDMTVDVVLQDLSEIDGASGYFYETFESCADNTRPDGWSGSFCVESGHGSDGKVITHSFWYLDGPRNLITNPVFMGDNPVFSFDYRVMQFDINSGEYVDQPFSGTNLEWYVRVSTDNGQTYTDLYYSGYGEHESNADYQTFTLDVSPYANQVCMFKIYVNRDYGMPEAFYFDIDNFQIGTQKDRDFSVVSKIKGLRVLGVNTEAEYTVSVRNEGKESMDGYSLHFYDGETEIGMVQGSSLASGSSEDLSFTHAFTEEGEHTLTARIESDQDQFSANNGSRPFYLSVVEEGTKGIMVESYEGEDLHYNSPISFYYPYSFSQVLYRQDDLKVEEGEAISGIALRYFSDVEIERTRLTVWIGETDSTSLMNGATPVSVLTKVFDGTVDIEALDGGNLVIEFQTPYLYQGGNLAVSLYKESNTVLDESQSMAFYGFYSLSTVSVSATSSDAEINVDEEGVLSQVTAVLNRPATIFLTRSDIAFSKVTFNVIDQNNNPVSNATLTFNGTELPEGQYVVENVADGTYPYVASLNGETIEGTVTVAGTDVTETVQFQHVANEFNASKNMIRVYPNPTVDKIHIDVAEGAREIGLYDISGRLVRKASKVPAGVMEMDLSGCRNGLYLLMVDGQAFKVTKR